MAFRGRDRSPRPEEARDLGGMRALVDGIVVSALAAGAVIRLWMLWAAPLQPAHPVAWFLWGTLRDLVVASAAGALALIGARRRIRLPLFLAAAFLLVIAVAHVIWAEALVYFGHPPHREDASRALNVDFARQSLDPGLLLRIALVLALLCGGFLWARRRSRAARSGFARVPRLAVVALAAAALSAAPWPVPLRATADHPLFALRALLAEHPLKDARGALRIPPPEVPPESVRRLAPSGRDFVDPAYPLAYRAPASAAASPGLRPNIVLVVMEGVRAHEIGAYGCPVPDVTPNLDRLAAEGVRVERAYSAGCVSPEGELALWYGLLSTPNELVMTARPRTALVGLPELLRDAGWRSFLWIHNSDQTFYREDAFYGPRGFRMIDGRDFDPNDARTNWGLSDHVLAARAVVAMDQLQEPFAAMMLTISNHHPFQVPPDVKSPLRISLPERRGIRILPGLPVAVGLHTVPMLKTIHYTDEAVGDFFERARKRPWFSRTIFVIASDHGLAILPLEGPPTPHGLQELRHGVPLIFYSPLLPGGRVVPGPASLTDVLPTVLGLAGVKGTWTGVGTDLLAPDRDPDRPVVMLDSDARTVSVASGRFVYHGTLPQGVVWNPKAFVDESLVDVAADPEGRRDASASEAATFRRLSEVARVYLGVYPWLVAEGRSGTRRAPVTAPSTRAGTTP